MTHSINHDIDKELRTLILNTANDNPAPLMGNVASVSDDGHYINVNLKRGGTLPNVKVFSGDAAINKEVILIFIDGDLNDPRAFIEDASTRIPFYNLVENGNFAKYRNGVFDKWMGGKLTTNSFYGTNGCEIEAGTSLISDFIDITSLTNEDAFTLSFIWLNEGFEIEVFNQDYELITALPQVLGTLQSVGHVDEWRYQRFNYLRGDVTKVKIRLTNKSSTSTYIDGIRIWNPDDYQEWFPHRNDNEE